MVVCRNSPFFLLFFLGWPTDCVEQQQDAMEHSGNKWLRQVARQHLTQYDDAVTKQAKSDIVSTIIEMVRAKSQHDGGGFIAKDKDTGLWWEVGT
jgi:hypothetical protein